MAGIAIVLDVLRKNHPNFNAQSKTTLHSFGRFSAATALAAGTPFAYKALFGDFRTPVAHCDAGTATATATWSDDYVATSLRTASERVSRNDAVQSGSKEYVIEEEEHRLLACASLAFGLMILQALLEFYLPANKPRADSEDDTDDFEERKVDFVTPFKEMAKHIGRGIVVGITLELLQSVVVYHVSKRTAWKLLKDVPKSAMRKAGRRLPKYVYIFRVSKTTFRGQFLRFAASWIVQVSIETYRFLKRTVFSKEENDEVETVEEVRLLCKKVLATTVKCGVSLVFVSVGAGIGASLMRPSIGHWIGCFVGDVVGQMVVTNCARKFFHADF